VPSPSTLLHGGVEYQEGEVSATAAQRVASSDAAVDIFVYQHDGGPSPVCAQLAAAARVVSETKTQIVIASFGYVHHQASEGTQNCIVMSSPDRPDYAALHLALTRPLGNRALLDAKTGRRIGLANGQLPPSPAYVPSGYTETTTPRPFDAASNFVAVRQFWNDARDTIEIRERSASAWSQSGTVIGHDTIDGQPATTTSESYQRCLSWLTTDGMVDEVCSLVRAGRPYLSPAELIKIARGLR